MAGGGILGDKRPYFHHCVLQHGIRGNIDLPYTACAIVDHFDLMAEDDSGGPNIFEGSDLQPTCSGRSNTPTAWLRRPIPRGTELERC